MEGLMRKEALKLLDLESKQNSDTYVENEPVSTFCYLKMRDFLLARTIKIKPMHIEQ